MAIRQTPEAFFATRANVQVQEPIQVSAPVGTAFTLPSLDPTMMMFLLGIAAILGLVVVAIIAVNGRKC